MRITTHGFKARDHALRLGGLCVLTAPNGSGKSAVADAIRFAALGYVPHLGKRLQDSAALLRGRRTDVEVAFDDLHVVRRTLALTEDGGYRSTVACSWLNKAKPSEHEAEALRLLGRDVRDVEECLDVRTLLDATPNQRAARLQELLSAAAASAEDTAAAIAERTVQRLADVEDTHMPEDYTNLLPLLSPGIRAVLKGLAPLLLAKLREADIQAVCDWSNASKREAAAAAKNKSAAAVELRERLAVRDSAGADDVARLESERDRLQREIGGIAERVRAAEAKRAAIGAAAAELRRATERLDTARTQREAVSRDLVAHAADPRRLAEVEAALDALQAPTPEEQPEAGQLLAQATEAEKQAASVVIPDPGPKRSESLRREVERIGAEIEAVAQSPWHRVREIGLVIEADARGNGERVVRLRGFAGELQALADAHAPDLRTLQAEQGQMEIALAEAIKREADAAFDRGRAVQSRDGHLRQAERCRAAASEILGAASAAYDRARAEHAAHREPLVSERDALRRAIDRRRQDAADADAAMIRAESTHAAATKLAAELGSDVESVEDARGSLQADLAQVVAQLSEHGRLKAARDELTALVDELAKAEIQRDVFAALEWAVQRVRALQMTEAGGPLVSQMRQFLQAAGRREEPFFHAAQNQCDVGWLRPGGGESVLIQALSGGEWCLFATALTAAIIALRGAPVRVLLVEAGEMDQRTLAGLLAGIEATSDGLTSAIVLTPHRPEQVSPGWQIVHLDGQRQTAAA